MGRILSNAAGLAFAKEDSRAVLPGSPTWYTLEPNNINSLGADISTVARNPISQDRQRRKGTIIDLDSAVEWEGDLTLDHLIHFMEALCFSTAANGDMVWRGANAASGGYTISAATAAQGSKAIYAGAGAKTLVFARGYALSANNGLKPLSADLASSDTQIDVAGNSVETAPSNATVELAGVRCSTGDLDLDVTSGVGTLTSAADIADWSTLGLSVGQYIHVGGLTSSEQFSAATGFARITAIASGALTLDKLGAGMATDPGTGETVDILFGQFIRNVAVDHADFLEQYIQFEATWPDLETGPADGYEYPEGNLCDSFTFTLPLTDKATMTAAFVGTDTPVPTTSRKTNAATPVDPTQTGAFNTSADIARMRVTQVDETGITTDFKSLSLTLSNNISPEKVLGTLGAQYVNYGNFEVGFEGQLVFTNSAVVQAIRENETLGLDFSLRNDDGGVYVEIPSMTLGGGDKEIPENESVLINITGEAFNDATLGTSLGVSLFPALP
tara:strand:+ start:32050 stop:33555 length:1506 start_codon:yes stop_codon:yes gene_type:complete